MEIQEANTHTAEKAGTQSDLLYRTRSEEVQEIIGRMPSWIIRWGITVIGLVVLGAFIGAALIKSPDIMQCQVMISPEEVPALVYVAENSRIQQLLVKEGDHVDKGSPLAVLDNTIAGYKQVLIAKDIARTIDTSLNIGQALRALPVKDQAFPGQLQKVYVDLMVSINHYLRDKPLKSQEYEWQQEIRANAAILLDMCNRWEQQYLLKSPDAGQVSFLKTLYDDVPLKADEAFMAIVKPAKPGAIVVTASVPPAAWSKISEGQLVFIKPDAYPAREFGMLKGRVSRRSVVPVKGLYTIGITLDNGLLTTTGRQLLCQSELSATGELVLQDKSLLQKLFEKY